MTDRAEDARRRRKEAPATARPYRRELRVIGGTEILVKVCDPGPSPPDDRGVRVHHAVAGDGGRVERGRTGSDD